MYSVNDMVVYGNNGVCKIVDITATGFNSAQKELLYYVLKPALQNCVIYAPTDTKVFMRPVLSAQEVEQLINSIPEVQIDTNLGSNKQQLEEYYRTVVKTHDCAKFIKLVMSLYHKKNAEEPNTKSGIPYERIMKQVEELIYNEFSVALGISVDEVQRYIATKVDSTHTMSSLQEPCNSLT